MYIGVFYVILLGLRHVKIDVIVKVIDRLDIIVKEKTKS